MRITSYVGCALVGFFLSANPPTVRADDDWEDYYEDLEDYYEDLEDARKEAREDYHDDLEDYYDDLADAQKDRARYSYRYGSGGYAVEPYWSYPQEYYIFGGHPSRYYYSYPDRYYSQQYRYNATPRYRSYGSQSDPNIWRNDVYGYERPYRDGSGRYGRRQDGSGYRYYDRNDGYRYQDRGKYDRRYRR